MKRLSNLALVLTISLLGSIPALAINPAPYPYLPPNGSVEVTVASGQTLTLGLSEDAGVLTVTGLTSVPSVTHVALYNMDYKPNGLIAGFQVTVPGVEPTTEMQTPAVADGSVMFWAAFTTQVYSTGLNEYFANFPYGLYMLDLGQKDYPETGAWTTRNNAYFYMGIDTIPPVITCPEPPILPADETGYAQYVPTATATDNAPGPVSVTCSPSGPSFPVGVHTVTCTAVDAAGHSATASFYVVVYDPSAGFVTGGGWIDSPAGAYVADPALTGKASFGFVSKYVKGKSVPTGTTEFQFRVANLNFHSSSYDWLVVNQAGTNAQFKGTGTINGAGSYKFMLWAGDGSLDSFRIKIWLDLEEDVVYDNAPLGGEQVIGGGSIVVHKK